MSDKASAAEEHPLRRAKGEEIPLPMRIVHVAVDAAFQRMLGGMERAVRLAREHAGGGLDPEVAACLADDANEILEFDEETSVWDDVSAREQRPPLILEGEAIDRALATMGDFADLISPYLTGHSAGVADWRRRPASAAGSTRPRQSGCGAPRSSTTSGEPRSVPVRRDCQRGSHRRRRDRHTRTQR